MSGKPTSDRAVWSEEQVRALGVSTDLTTAAAILGIGRTTAHTLVHAGQFPVPVIRVGHRYLVPVAPILQLLALPSEPPATKPTTQPPPAVSPVDQGGESAGSAAADRDPRRR